MPRTREHNSTDAALDLDVRALHRARSLRDFSGQTVTWERGRSESSVTLWILSGSSVVVLSADSYGKRISEIVDITWTSPNFGGERPWWICPECSRRCAILYATGANPFACRLCADLAYTTAQGDAFTRAMRRHITSRRRLGWSAAGPDRGRPKGMHAKTFARLMAQYRDSSAAANHELQGWLAKFPARTDGPNCAQR